METIIRNITDLAADERTVIEGLIGTPLAEDQQIVVQVLDASADVNGRRPRTAADYAILADLDQMEADQLFDAMTQRSPGREFPP